MTAEAFFNRKAILTIRAVGRSLYNRTFDKETGVGDVAIVITDLAFEFDIEHNSTKHPNQCLVKIMNLSEETRASLSEASGAYKMTLEVGYEKDLAVIFSGDITYVLSSLKGADWVTEIQGGDGDHINADARVNKTYKPGTKVGSVLEDLFNDVGQQLPDVIKNNETFQKTFNNGIAVSGKLKDVVPKLLEPHGYKWSTQDGKPLILRTDDTSGQTWEVSEATGMIDSPEFGRPDRKTRLPNVTIHSLLYPQLRPGNPVRVKSRDLNGTYKVTKVKHRGQTHGNDWFTEIEIKPTQVSKGAYKPNSNTPNNGTKKTS